MSETLKFLIFEMPDSPRSKRSQDSWTPLAKGETIPDGKNAMAATTPEDVALAITLTGDDIAEVVVFAASRPRHVDIAEVLVLPTDQASAVHLHRDG